MQRNDDPSYDGSIGRSPAGVRAGLGAALRPARARILRATSLVLALCGTGMAGCAIHWERAFYEGWRSANQRGAPADGAPVADVPQRLPDYERYERERQRARGTAVTAPEAPAPAASAASGPAPH